MEKIVQSARVVRFANFELDLDAGELRKSGLKLKFSGQPFEVLAILLEHPSAIVTREQLQKRLWPDSFVDFDHNLNSAINRIREALGDSAENPQFVETLPRRGYRFIAPVTKPDIADAEAIKVIEPPRSLGSGLAVRNWFLLAALVLALIVSAGWWFWHSSRHRITSVAVLPLANLSHDPEQDYFADGVSDELITRLANITGLKVTSRTSVMRFKGTKKSLPEIARELGVDGIVEGTVERAGDRVRISAQLIDASDDTHLWADTYERDLQDILAIQADVALAISHHVSVAVSSAQEKEIGSARTVNPRAYEFYLKGRHFYWSGEFRLAQENFEEAVKLDPHYARAYAGLVDAYWFEGKPVEGKAALQQALQLEPNLADAHASLGWSKLMDEVDWKGAEREFKFAIEHNPNSEQAHLWYGCELVWEGRFPEGPAQMRTAAELAPATSSINAFYGMGLYHARRYDEAVKQLKAAIELDPSVPAAYLLLGTTYSVTGNYNEAIENLQKGGELGKDRPNSAGGYRGSLAYAYAVAERREQAEAILDDFQKRPTPPSTLIALIYTGLGNKDQAFFWLNKAAEHRNNLIQLKVDPRWDLLRSDPRFQELINHLGFPN